MVRRAHPTGSLNVELSVTFIGRAVHANSGGHGPPYKNYIKRKQG